MREARLAARLKHRHAVTVYDVVEHDGQPCLVMELVPSQPLSEILHELGTLHEQEVATLGAQVASALAAAHAAGVVHRDVKPANILVADDGTARISDFGIAHAFGDTTLTSTGMLTGTPAYLAPEVARGGESGFASDVFSLGSTLYAALEGRPPFGEGPNPIGLLHRVASGQAEPPRHAGALTPLLTRMLSPNPDARPTMAEVAAARPVRRRPRRLAARRRRRGPGRRRGPSAPGGRPDRGAGRPWSASLGTPVPPASPLGDRRRRAPRRCRLRRRRSRAAAPRRRRRSQRDPGGAAHSDPGRVDVRSLDVRSVADHGASDDAGRAGRRRQYPGRSIRHRYGASDGVAHGYRSAGRGTADRRDLPLLLLVPTRLDEAWTLMTADYQTRVAGGRQAYQRFWDGFSKVTATEVASSSPSTVSALITYTTTAGAVIRERTTFTLVDEGGVLKISRSTVTSRS